MIVKRKISIFFIALLVVLLSAGVLQAQSGSGNRGRSNFDWIVARRLTITPLGLTVAGDTVLGGDLTLTAQPAITMVSAATLSPTGSYQPITSAGAVGFGAITAGSAGAVLTVVNTVNQTITITDTGTLKLSGNAVLGQYDAITFISDGTNWIQTSKSDN